MKKKSKAKIPQETLDELKQLFPGCVSGENVNFEKLRKLLGDNIILNSESYGLNWFGRDKTFDQINASVTGKLTPQTSLSVNPSKTKNVLIDGDNLQVLKILRKNYKGKIKMIYIDPPYNTGKDRLYQDNFMTVDQDILKTIKDSKDSAELSHSAWISMIYARLFVARELLSEDGVIFVSIGIAESFNLRRVMNDIFGEDNLITEIVWNSKYTISNDKKFISNQHEYIMAFAKNYKLANFNLLPRTEKADKSYTNPDNDPRGPWKATPLHAKSGKRNSTYVFKKVKTYDGKQVKPRKWTAPDGRFPRYNKETLQRLENDNRITCGVDGTFTPQVKSFLKEVKQGITPGSLWKYDDVGHTHFANEELASILGKGIFDNPKPTKLIKRMIHLSTEPRNEDIVLDFFAGSGTTAHAVLEQNKEDGGNRIFICVQDPWNINRGEYKTISDISRERITKVIKNIQKESNLNKFNMDLGFKILKLKN